MKSVAAFAAIAVVVTGLFILSNARLPAAPAPTGPAPQVATSTQCPQCAQLSQRIEDLQRGLAGIQAELLSLRGQWDIQRVDVPGASKQPVSADPGNALAARAADEERHRAYVTELAQAFNNERTTPGWATQVAARIDTAIGADEALRDVAHHVECHQQTCRVRIEDDGSGRLSQRLPFIAVNLVDVLPEVTAERVDDGNGRGAMVLYMSNQRTTPLVSK